ncbi:MAG: Hsp70 family protein [Bryobacteraceae bacterium]
MRRRVTLLKRGIGIDFGTTNSAIAVAGSEGIRLASFPFMESIVETFRSVLFFENASERGLARKPLAGPAAIERYLQPNDGGRLIQSLKSFAASRTFQHTQIGGKQRTLEELIGIFLKLLRTQAEEQLGPLGTHAIVGRPAQFVGAAAKEDESLALARLRKAFEIAGFTKIVFEYEPIGASYSYAEQLQQHELVLIADFGGGTSDFSLVNLSPGNHSPEIIATSGVPIGGDIFDARIVRHLVSPMLGLGTTYRSLKKCFPCRHRFS